MQKAARWFAQIALLALLVRTGAAADIPTSLGIYLSFDSAPAAASVDEMKHAVEGLLRPTGMTLAWRLISQSSGTEVFSRLAVIRFKGSCEVEAPAPQNLFGSFGETHVLATTAVTGGEVSPYTNVQCDEVRRVLAFVRHGAGVLERERALGLALGRVVAHELYHILADTGRHSSEGIAKATQMLPDLVSGDDLRFDPSSARAIEDRLKPKE
ncbi:MAG TPA: hypothetical protein VMB03_13320 [Bryobacteraceae bacterium]|nr:hypothetical protein [Bryobacteraceae bacterium]